jgi:U3 small nucleolar RNA-associated protein 12
VSGSADKDVKFWEFEMREEGEGEKVVSRLGVETVVSFGRVVWVYRVKGRADDLAQDQAVGACACSDTQDDG